MYMMSNRLGFDFDVFWICLLDSINIELDFGCRYIKKMKGSSRRPPLPPSPSPLHPSSNSERSNPTDRELGVVIPENTETQSEDDLVEVAVPEFERL